MSSNTTTSIGIISATLDEVGSSLRVEGWAVARAGGTVKVAFGSHFAEIRLSDINSADTGQAHINFWSVEIQLSHEPIPPSKTITATLHESKAFFELQDRMPRVVISRATASGGKLSIVGWCTGREPADFVEVKMFGKPEGRAEPLARPDVQAKHPLIEDPLSGFSFHSSIQTSLTDGRVWVEVDLRRGATKLASASVMVEPDGVMPPPVRLALQAVLHPFPAPGSQRALARSFTPVGRRRLIASLAFQKLWSTGEKCAAFGLRNEIVRAMIELGEIDSPIQIRLKSGDLVLADPSSDSVIARKFLLDGTYEEGLINCINRLLKKGDRVFDIGACYGHMALACANAVGSDGEVISIEPNPTMASGLRRTLERNGRRQVKVVEVALGEAPGIATLRVAKHNLGGSRLGVAGVSATDEEFGKIFQHLSVVSLDTGDLGKPVQPEPKSIELESFEVEMRTLDSIAEEYGCPQLIKIDIEGAELLCLKGGRRLLLGEFGCQPIITMEYSSLFPTFGGRREEAFELLLGAGYSAYRMTKGKVGGGDLIEVPNSESAPDHDDLFFIPPGREPFVKN